MKKISIAQMSRMAKIPKAVEEAVTINDKEFTIYINQYLPVTAITAIVDRVVNSCFDEDNYHPEYFEMVFFALILGELTNIEIPSDEEGNIDLAIVHQWMKCTNVLNTLLDNEFVAKIYSYCCEKLRFKRTQIEKKGKIDELIESLSAFAEIADSDEFKALINDKTMPS